MYNVLEDFPLNGLKRFACGLDHSLVLKNENGNIEVYGFGLNTYNCISCEKTNIQETYMTPTLLSFFRDKKPFFVACSNNISYVLCHESLFLNTVYAMGIGDHYKLGKIPSQIKKQNKLFHTTVPRCLNLPKNIISISCGAEHSLLLTQDGVLYLLGEESPSLPNTSPSPTADSYDAIDLSPFFPNEVITHCHAGATHSICCTKQGNTYTWGNGVNGQLGLGNRLNFATPQLVSEASSPLLDPLLVSAGKDHSAVLTKEGTVYLWGSNGNGQLGLGKKSTGDALSPMYVSWSHFSEKKLQDVFCGHYYTLFLAESGEMYGCGVRQRLPGKREERGGEEKKETEEMQGRETTKDEGAEEESIEIEQLGRDDSLVIPEQGNCELFWSEAEDSEGSLERFLSGEGEGLKKKKGSPQEDLVMWSPQSLAENVVAMTGNCHHGLFVTRKKVLYSWGENDEWSSVRLGRIIGESNVEERRDSTYPLPVCADTSGELMFGNVAIDDILEQQLQKQYPGQEMWITESEVTGRKKGEKEEGEEKGKINPTEQKEDIYENVSLIQVESMEKELLMLSSKGLLFILDGGKKRNENESQQSANASLFSLIPLEVPIASIVCGSNHILALSEDNRIWVYGKGNLGQLGLGTQRDCFTFVHLSKPAEGVVKSLAAKNDCSAMIFQYQNDVNNTCLFTWGDNSDGRLGFENSAGAKILSPQPVSLKSGNENHSRKVALFAFGEAHSIALTREGYAFGWGSSSYGRLNMTEKNFFFLPQKLTVPWGEETWSALSCGQTHTIIANTQKKKAFLWGKMWNHISDYSVRELDLSHVTDEIDRVISATNNAYLITKNQRIFALGEENFLAGTKMKKKFPLETFEALSLFEFYECVYVNHQILVTVKKDNNNLIIDVTGHKKYIQQNIGPPDFTTKEIADKSLTFFDDPNKLEDINISNKKNKTFSLSKNTPPNNLSSLLDIYFHADQSLYILLQIIRHSYLQKREMDKENCKKLIQRLWGKFEYFFDEEKDKKTQILMETYFARYFADDREDIKNKSNVCFPINIFLTTLLFDPAFFVSTVSILTRPSDVNVFHQLAKIVYANTPFHQNLILYAEETFFEFAKHFSREFWWQAGRTVPGTETEVTGGPGEERGNQMGDEREKREKLMEKFFNLAVINSDTPNFMLKNFANRGENLHNYLIALEEKQITLWEGQRAGTEKQFILGEEEFDLERKIMDEIHQKFLLPLLSNFDDLGKSVNNFMMSLCLALEETYLETPSLSLMLKETAVSYVSRFYLKNVYMKMFGHLEETKALFPSLQHQVIFTPNSLANFNAISNFFSYVFNYTQNNSNTSKIVAYKQSIAKMTLDVVNSAMEKRFFLRSTMEKRASATLRINYDLCISCCDALETSKFNLSLPFSLVSSVVDVCFQSLTKIVSTQGDILSTTISEAHQTLQSINKDSYFSFNLHHSFGNLSCYDFNLLVSRIPRFNLTLFYQQMQNNEPGSIGKGLIPQEPSKDTADTKSFIYKGLQFLIKHNLLLFSGESTGEQLAQQVQDFLFSNQLHNSLFSQYSKEELHLYLSNVHSFFTSFNYREISHYIVREILEEKNLQDYLQLFEAKISSWEEMVQAIEVLYSKKQEEKMLWDQSLLHKIPIDDTYRQIAKKKKKKIAFDITNR